MVRLSAVASDKVILTMTVARLNDCLQEMTDREMDARTRARSLQMGEVLEETDRADDQYQCAICKVFCYLSQITCQCTNQTKVVCIDHVDQLCKCPPANHTLRKRFSDTEPQDLLVNVSSAQPSLPCGATRALVLLSSASVRCSRRASGHSTAFRS